MSKLDQIFEDYIKEEGLGRIYTGENGHIQRIYQDFEEAVHKQRLKNPALPKPTLYITTLSPDFKVFVFKEKGHYFIGISIGAIESLWKFFQFLYSQPYFDEEFGNSKLEHETKLDLSQTPDYLIEYFYNFDMNASPKCPIRNSYSYQLYYRAVNYLLLHEYAHVTHGHVDYLSRGKMNYMYYEKDSVKESNANIEKSLEYDADSAATLHSIMSHTEHLLFGNLMNNEHNLKLEIQKTNIAVYFLNKLTELQDLELRDFPNRTHPISDQRTSSHGTLVTTFLMQNKNEFDFDVEGVIEYGADIFLEKTVKGFARMFNNNILDDRFFFFFSKQGVPYNNEIRKGWNAVREALEKLAYVEIAPEDEMLTSDGSFDYNEVLNKKRDNNVDSSGEV